MSPERANPFNNALLRRFTLPLLHAFLYLQEVVPVSVEVEVASAGRRLWLEPA